MSDNNNRERDPNRRDTIFVANDPNITDDENSEEGAVGGILNSRIEPYQEQDNRGAQALLEENFPIVSGYTN